MNKNKLIVLLVLLVAVIGLTMGSVAAGSTTKTKYKKIVVKTKLNKEVSKKEGKYKVTIFNGKIYSGTKKVTNNGLEVKVKKRNKAINGKNFSLKIYYKEKGKSLVTKWDKGHIQKDTQYVIAPNNIKIKKVAVRFKK